MKWFLDKDGCMVLVPENIGEEKELEQCQVVDCNVQDGGRLTMSNHINVYTLSKKATKLALDIIGTRQP